MERKEIELVVIGAGPGGYVAAIRAAQLGLSVALVEKEAPGGVCLNVGCIPSKALIAESRLVAEGREALEAAGAKVDLSGFDYGKVWRKSRLAADRLSKGVSFLLKKNKVEYLSGTARLAAPGRVLVSRQGGSEPELELQAKAVILATGSRPKAIPGFETDGERVLDSTGFLMSPTLPKSLAILGAGAIGMEIAYVAANLGVEVSVVELLDRVLPLEDPESSAVVAKAFAARGIKLLTGMKAAGLARGGPLLELRLEPAGGGEGGAASAAASAGSGGATAPPAAETLRAERLLVAVGRSPNTAGLGLEELGVRLERGFVKVGDSMESSVAGIYAIGDIVASPLLAHVASKEGELAAEAVASRLRGREPPSERRLDPLLVPSAVYCEPEVGSFGWSEAAAKAAGLRFEVARFPYRGVGKAVAVGKAEGQVKLLHDPASGEILGASVVGESATEIVHELLLARRAELRVEDVADLVHAHPTISEGVMEAARAALGRAVHA